MNVTPSRVQACASWIKSLDQDALKYLRELLEAAEGGDPTGVGARLPTIPPDREGGAEAPLEFTEEEV